MRYSNPYYPVYFDVSGKRVLVVGGGSTGERKVLHLAGRGAEVKVVSPEITDRLRGLWTEGRIKVELRPFRDEDVNGIFMAFAATSNPKVNHRVFELCKERGIPVNVVDSPSQSTFIVPSVMERGFLSVAVSTSGVSPALSRTLRERIEGFIDGIFPSISEYLDFLSELREEVKDKVRDGLVRRKILLFLGREASLELFEKLGREGFLNYLRERFRF